MFDPTRDQARQFFVEAWRKQCERLPQTPMELMAAQLIQEHPEYHSLLSDPEAIHKEFTPEDGQINPFLHLSLHLAVQEQLSINQPPGIRDAFDKLCHKHGDAHKALHDTIECLGETIFNAQRNRSAPDGMAYVEAMRRKAG